MYIQPYQPTASMITATQGSIRPAQFNASLFDRFISFLDVKDRTLAGYTTNLKQFFVWMDLNGVTDPQREDIKNYKAYLDSRDFTAGTQAQYLRAVRQFFRWTASEGLYPNVADNVKGVKVKSDNTKKEAFNEEDIKAVLESIDRSSLTGKRDYALILLSVIGGLRIIEMQRANIGDIQTIKGQKVLYIQGKGRNEKDEYVKLVPGVYEAIEDYLQERGTYRKTDPLFPCNSNRNKGGHMTIPSMSRLIKNVFRNAGFDCDKLTAHSLRHTSNTLLFKAGADLYQVQQHARHSDPKTTEIYIHAANREKDRSEEQIYNQIFHTGEKTAAQTLIEAVEELNEEQAQKVLAYIQSAI